MNHQASLSRSTARYSVRDSAGGHSGASLASTRYSTKTMDSGISASPKTFTQPKAAARPGPNRAARAVPELPAPAIPSAVPWCSGGYQRDASGRATAKEAPATPRNRPRVSTWA